MRSTGFRHAVAAIGACSLALAVTSCGSNDDDSASGKTRITVNCRPPASAKVDRQFFDQDVAAFERQHSDIDVVAHDAFPCEDPKTFDAKLAGGQMEDVFYTYFTDVKHVVATGQAADLTPYVKELKSYGTIQEQLRDIYTVDGKVYGIPRTGYSMGLVYNKKLFEKAGLDPDKPPTTWEEVRTDARRIAALGGGTVATPTTAPRTRAAGTSPPSCTPRAATWSPPTARRPPSTPPRATPSCGTCTTCAGRTTPWAASSSWSSTTCSR